MLQTATPRYNLLQTATRCYIRLLRAKAWVEKNSFILDLTKKVNILTIKRRKKGSIVTIIG